MLPNDSAGVNPAPASNGNGAVAPALSSLVWPSGGPSLGPLGTPVPYRILYDTLTILAATALAGVGLLILFRRDVSATVGSGIRAAKTAGEAALIA